MFRKSERSVRANPGPRMLFLGVVPGSAVSARGTALEARRVEPLLNGLGHIYDSDRTSDSADCQEANAVLRIDGGERKPVCASRFH